jgi:hypothetical protein
VVQEVVLVAHQLTPQEALEAELLGKGMQVELLLALVVGVLVAVVEQGQLVQMVLLI